MNNNSIQSYIKKFYHQIGSKLLLAIFGALLVGTKELTMLSWYVYAGIISIYLFVTLFFLWNSIFRQYSHILDMLLVLSLLWGAQLSNFYTFAFLIFPIVSYGVYIDRYTYDKFFLLEYVMLLVVVDLSLGICEERYYICQAIAIGALAILNRMAVQRMEDDEKRIKIMDIADDYFVEQNKSYEVYQRIIEYLNGQNIDVTSITCFESDPQICKYHLVNSSYLVSKYRLTLTEKERRNLKKGMTADNIDLTLEGTSQEKNTVYPVPQPNTSSIFLFVLVYKTNKYELNEINLEPLFLRMARIISFERIMRTKRDATIQDIIQKSHFVNGATNIMHFLKNRLTPIQTLVDLARNEGNVQQLDNYNDLLFDTAKSAQKEINVILEKAEYLLNKKNNPFIFAKKDCHALEIFVTLFPIWRDLLPNDAIIDIEIEKRGDALYESNTEGLEILFTDIIGNMHKYSKNYNKCLFRQDDNFIITIIFENDFYNKKEILSLINDINNPHKDAVIYRTSYGVTNIRAIAENLSIVLKAELITKDDLELYHLELILEPKKNEEITNN